MILLAHAMAQISINTYSLVALACVIKSHTAKLAQKPSYLHLGIKAVGDSHVRESNFLKGLKIEFLTIKFWYGHS